MHQKKYREKVKKKIGEKRITFVSFNWKKEWHSSLKHKQEYKGWDVTKLSLVGKNVR